MSEEVSAFTPSMAEVLKQAMESRLADVHTALPGTITKYDAAKQQCDVQPNIQRKYVTGELVNIPVIPNVPVVFPRSQKAFVSFPLVAGDQVLLIFSERSLDRWLVSGGQVDPADPRKHHLTDAVAIPGLYPFSKPVTASTDALRLGNDKSQIDLKPDGKMSMKNLTSGDELVSLVHQMADLLSTTTVNTIFGPMKLNDFAQFAVIKGKLATLKE